MMMSAASTAPVRSPLIEKKFPAFDLFFVYKFDAFDIFIYRSLNFLLNGPSVFVAVDLKQSVVSKVYCLTLVFNKRPIIKDINGCDISFRSHRASHFSFFFRNFNKFRVAKIAGFCCRVEST
jgi:hypothetical protein